MEYNVNKIDEANAVVEATLPKELIETKLDQIAKNAAKSMDIQGFRKGKVPVAIIKQRYGAKMAQDAEGEALREVFTAALNELEISNDRLVGEPAVTKFDKQEDGSIQVELKVSARPEVNLGDYKALLPEVEVKDASEEEVDARLSDIAGQNAPLEKIKRKRMAKKGDYAVIDFEGFKDGVAFDGGKADGHTLELGSGSFIPGFEDQVIGMKYEEQKDITVTFPEEYQSADLAGAEVVFKVTLHELQEKGEPVIDDEFAKQVLQGEENADLAMLKDKVSEQIKNEKMNSYYQEELKPAYIEALVEANDFAIPASILEQEENQALNNQIRQMKEDEIKALQEDQAKIDAMRAEVNPDAVKSVKATFIVDALAKAEGVEVSDQEVSQTIYYEAMMTGQDGQAMIKQYEEQGYLPAIKMSMIEQKVITKLLDEKAGK
ncbi:MAG: trigger factor [Campylobacterales bacterium]|nr:trigger factor [Campylobacterales bacterium]